MQRKKEELNDVLRLNFSTQTKRSFDARDTFLIEYKQEDTCRSKAFIANLGAAALTAAIACVAMEPRLQQY
jgi:hypothetical protein